MVVAPVGSWRQGRLLLMLLSLGLFGVMPLMAADSNAVVSTPLRGLVGDSPLEACTRACPTLPTDAKHMESLGGSMEDLDSDSYAAACALVSCMTESAAAGGGCKDQATAFADSLTAAGCLCGCDHRKTMGYCQKSVNDAETPLSFDERSDRCLEHEKCRTELDNWWTCLGQDSACEPVRESMKSGFDQCAAEARGEETARDTAGGSEVSKRKMVDPRDDTSAATSRWSVVSMVFSVALFIFIARC